MLPNPCIFIFFEGFDKKTELTHSTALLFRNLLKEYKNFQDLCTPFFELLCRRILWQSKDAKHMNFVNMVNNKSSKSESKQKCDRETG